MLFLVRGTLVQTRYMGQTTKTTQTRLVEAHDEGEAEQKYRCHFEKQSREYAISYWVEDCQAFETID
jgi:hypothetical protein